MFDIQFVLATSHAFAHQFSSTFYKFVVSCVPGMWDRIRSKYTTLILLYQKPLKSHCTDNYEQPFVHSYQYNCGTKLFGTYRIMKNKTAAPYICAHAIRQNVENT